ncbi:Uncharacterized protein AC505_2122 [Pseudomonas syringae pv. maculicola]|nr:Uncharacterized protein AC505_2122 [Pseudomonas syringae pv. maculicola]
MGQACRARRQVTSQSGTLSAAQVTSQPDALLARSASQSADEKKPP